jgi:hypothetical protein
VNDAVGGGLAAPSQWRPLASPPPPRPTPPLDDGFSDGDGDGDGDGDDVAAAEEAAWSRWAAGLFGGVLADDEVRRSSVWLRDYLATLSATGDGDSDSDGYEGHNVAGVASAERWFRFDDEFVTELPPLPSPSPSPSQGQRGQRGQRRYEASVVTESAYLLFYRKRHLSPDNLLRYV